MGELDLGLQDFVDTGPTQPQLTAYVSASYWPFKGVMLGGALERYDEDMNVNKLARDAASLNIQYFPLAHWELMLTGKLEFQGAEYSDPASFALLQLHYYL